MNRRNLKVIGQFCSLFCRQSWHLVISTFHVKIDFQCISGIHAREWISPATVTYVMNNLVTNPQYSDLLNMFDFFILPVTNPDGWENDRFRFNDLNFVTCKKNWTWNYKGVLFFTDTSTRTPLIDSGGKIETRILQLSDFVPGWIWTGTLVTNGDMRWFNKGQVNKWVNC